MKKMIVLFLVVIIAAMMAWRIYRTMHQEVAQSIDKLQAAGGLPVRVFTVKAQDLKETVVISGGIEAIQQVAIAPKISERITTLHVQTGDKVTPGQRLVTLDHDQSQLRLQQAQAQAAEAAQQLQKLRNGSRPEEITKAEAAMNLARLEFQRQQNLFKETATTLQNVQRAESEFQAAQADYDMTKKGPRDEDIRIAESNAQLAQVMVEQAQKDLADHFLEAPVAGVITRRLFEPGDMIDKNITLFYLMDIQKVYLTIDAPELYLPGLAVGQTVAVTVDALPGRPFTGTVAEINPRADQKDRSFATRILIDNPQQNLWPGMFGRAHIVVQHDDRSLLIPGDTVRRDAQQKTFVWAINPDMTVRRVDITTEKNIGDRISVSQGISEGMILISLAPESLQPGMKVTITNTPEDVAAGTK